MTADRIKEIQQETAFPDSISVCQALLKVWNECEQAKEMEKQQIIDAYKFGLSDEYVIGAEQYYNETFKSE